MEYKISIDQVVDAFLTLAGDEALSDGRVLCGTAAEILESWLDTQKELGNYAGSISYAAATMAFYRYTLKNSGNAQSIKAGDITVTDGSEKVVGYAQSLMDDALKAIAHLIKAKRFAFVKTEVC